MRSRNKPDRNPSGTSSPPDDGWIFPAPDPGTLPTEKLPDSEDLEQLDSPLVAPPGRRPAMPASPTRRSQAASGSSSPQDVAENSSGADDAGNLHDDLADAGDELRTIEPETWEDDDADGQAPSARDLSYARSGSTPNAEHDAPGRVITLPPRFHDLGIFDAIRDLIALACLISALTTTRTLGDTPILDRACTITITIGIVTLALVHVLRWIPVQPPLAAIRMIRIFGMVPVFGVALWVLLADLISSLPVLFAPLPEGPPVGIGVGIALMLLGAVVGSEPRAHEGYLPGAEERKYARGAVIAIGWVTAALLLLAVVMLAGRIFVTGWVFSLMTAINTMISAVLVGAVICAVIRRDKQWFVLWIAVISGLVVVSILDNTLRLNFADPVSVATGFVYLPILFTLYAFMVSRSFLRTMSLSFLRTDWITYALRIWELSIVMHTLAIIWNLAAATVVATGSSALPGTASIYALNTAAFIVIVVASVRARQAMLTERADTARTTAVSIAVASIVIGFVMVIVNSVATGAGAGLITGGVALTAGIAIALMLTVPQPLRDNLGAPDLDFTYQQARLQRIHERDASAIVINAATDRAARKTFPPVWTSSD